MTKKSIYLGIALLVIGCGRSSTLTPKAPTTSSSVPANAEAESESVASESEAWTEEEQRIVESAKKAYFAGDGSNDDRTQIDKPLRHEDGTWSVVLTPLPAVPGGHTIVNIDTDGKVLRISGGK
jgi:hypothetical protein